MKKNRNPEPTPAGTDPKAVKEWIDGFVEGYGKRSSIQSAWKRPLVAVADARDPLFNDLKRQVSLTHQRPEDLLPGATSVIAFFVPFQEDIPRSNAEGRLSSIGWAAAYVETNALIAELGQFLSKRIEEAGYRAATIPATHNYDPVTLMSDWSHKHIGYVAGLGDFGVHHLLITEQGCCGRLGSLVTTFPLKPTRRPGKPFCLDRAGQRCLQCLERCVFGALGAKGFDRQRCAQVCEENDQYHRDLNSTAICGKCSCLVPCSFGDPVKKPR